MTEHLKLGLFGGSFDPIHNGHIKLALLAKKQFNLNKIIFIPAKQPPHKKDKRLTPASRRLEMLSIGLKRYSHFEISRYEIDRKAATYTFQTVSHFKNLYRDAELLFLLGSDSLKELHTWKKTNLLLSLCTLIIGKRKGINLSGISFPKKSVRFIRQVLPDISSTDIRAMIKSGKSVSGLLPKQVEKYIMCNGLYKN